MKLVVTDNEGKEHEFDLGEDREGDPQLARIEKLLEEVRDLLKREAKKSYPVPQPYPVPIPVPKPYPMPEPYQPMQPFRRYWWGRHTTLSDRQERDYNALAREAAMPTLTSQVGGRFN